MLPFHTNPPTLSPVPICFPSPLLSGSAFARCLMDAMSWHMGHFQGRTIPSVHIEGDLSSSTLSYYLDLAQAVGRVVERGSSVDMMGGEASFLHTFMLLGSGAGGG